MSGAELGSHGSALVTPETVLSFHQAGVVPHMAEVRKVIESLEADG